MSTERDKEFILKFITLLFLKKKKGKVKVQLVISIYKIDIYYRAKIFVQLYIFFSIHSFIVCCNPCTIHVAMRYWLQVVCLFFQSLFSRCRLVAWLPAFICPIAHSTPSDSDSGAECQSGRIDILLIYNQVFFVCLSDRYICCVAVMTNMLPFTMSLVDLRVIFCLKTLFTPIRLNYRTLSIRNCLSFAEY